MSTIQKILITVGLVFFTSYNIYSQNCPNDKPFRGFMIDAPRGVETMDHYFRLIDFCQKEEMNSIIFRLTDDQGSAYLFTSHPELKMCDGAFTANELKTIIEYAQKRGIEMIPEIESFGHSKYITQTERYKFLNDGPAGADFNALCPVNDSTLVLLNDLYSEVASIFPGKYFHIGCDEVNWGASEMSKNALATRSKHQIWAEYVNKLNGCLKGIGKKTIIWGDVPIYHEKDILDLLDRDIVIMDWNYWETDKAKIGNVANTILNKGFQLIACPAVCWCAWGPRVGELQFQNINAYAEVYGNLNNPNNLGIILSNWVPKRYLQNSQWDTYTIAAEILKRNGNYNYMDAIPAFVKNHFGAKFDSSWEKVFKIIYKETPEWGCGQTDSLKFFPWSSEKSIRDIVLKNRSFQTQFSDVINLLIHCRNRVQKNKSDFEELLLTIEFMDYNFKRQNDLLACARSGITNLEAVHTFLEKVALEDQKMLSRIDPAWRLSRRGNPTQADKDNLWSFYLAADYSNHLRENPSEFLKVLREDNK